MLGVTPERFAALAARALAPKEPPTVGVAHLHAPPVSVAEQLLALRAALLGAGSRTFRALRQQRVTFTQPVPLGELHVRWTGPATVTAVADLGGEPGERAAS
jgi:segregation and condensation protein A